MPEVEILVCRAGLKVHARKDYAAGCFKDRRPLRACPLRRGCRARICFRLANFLKSGHAVSRRLRGPGASRPHGRDTSVGAYGHDLGRPRAEPATSEFRPVRLDIRWAAVAQLD
jgi:hypothetical protein